MHSDEVDDGDFRIYAGSLESKLGDGYKASAIVRRVRGVGGTCDGVFREEGIACGHRWATPSEALLYAVTPAAPVVRRQVLKAESLCRVLVG
jgi:hypothetical protein